MGVPLLVLAATSGCTREKTPARPPVPRPVSVLELRTVDPTRKLRLTGSAAAWKQENVGFEIGGRVDWIIEPGQDVSGRSIGPNGQLLSEGTVLARLDPTRYQLRVSTEEARVAAKDAQATALQTEIYGVLHAQLQAATADRDRATRERDRIQALSRQNQGSERELDQAETALKMAQAKVDQLEATIAARQAELTAVRAEAAQARETLKQARKDLEDCTLVAPFPGRGSATHVIPGAYVQPGQPVVSLIMMDPMMVEVAVSPATDRALRFHDWVQVFPPGSDQPMRGQVWFQDTVADPATRTFKVSILVRNYPVVDDLPLEWRDRPRISHTALITRRDLNDPRGELGTALPAIYTDPADGSYYVWHVANPPGESTGDGTRRLLRLRKVRVKPGERMEAIVGLYYFRELKDAGGLKLDDLVAYGVPQGLKDGDAVLLVRPQWLFRPGDLVEVLWDDPGPGSGYYVPMQALLPVDEHVGHLFVVREGQATRVKVEVTGRFGEYRRIRAADGRTAPLADGAQVILEGVHYLEDGEPVRVLKKEDPKL